jgi:hypothetical protein
MPADMNAPLIDRRKASDLYQRLKRMAAHYTPEWPAAKEDDPGLALADAFSAIAEGVIQQLNRSPAKNLIEFLNMLGVQLLPARTAVAPVQFRVNPRFDDTVLVRAPAQCSAPATDERPEDLPFETEQDLVATPSLLLDLVAVDPLADAVFRPPPGFLDLETAARPLPWYESISFSALGSKTLQLDRVEEIGPDDILRIRHEVLPRLSAHTAAECCPPETMLTTEPPRDVYIRVADKPAGRIVPLATPLPAAVPSGTIVEKVTDFAVFDSMNVQEHSLLLGHADVLNIEGSADVEVRVRHLAGTGANLSSLSVEWEYGAESESGEPEWLPFEVLADTTNGLRADGSAFLRKPPGEIIETEIAGNTSRWMRVRVRGPIPAAPPPPLPRLDEVTFTVKSAGDVAPDALFHNDATVELPGSPFGPEPRQFDRFYIGSEEVFSKRQADVKLDIKLIRAAQLASPAVVQFDTEVHAFATGPDGRLVEVIIPQDSSPPAGGLTEPVRETHEALDDTTVAFESAPAAIRTFFPQPDRLFVFVRGADGKIYLRFYSPASDQWTWIPLGSPSNDVRTLFDPAVTLDASGIPQVFVVGSDLKLYSRKVSPGTGGAAGPWHPHQTDGEVRLVSSPTVASLGTITRIYVSDPLGTIHEHSVDTATDPPTLTWRTVGHPTVVRADPRATLDDSAGAPLRSRAFAVMHEPGPATRLAYTDVDGHVITLRRDGAGAWTVDPGPAPAAVDMDSSPEGLLLEGGEPTERFHLFVRDVANTLWHRSPEDWQPLDRPSGDALRLSPAVLLSTFGTSRFLRVFVAEENRLAEFRFRYEADTARGGRLVTLVLDSNASVIDDEYKNRLVYVTSGPALDDTLRTIAAYGGPDRVLRLGAQWPAAPAAGVTYRILAQTPIATGTSSFGPDADATLEAGDIAAVQAVFDAGGAVIRVIDGSTSQFRRITSMSPSIVVEADWDAPLNTAADNLEYEVYEILAEGLVDTAALRAVALGPSSRTGDSSNNFYNGATLRIVAGTGAGEAESIAGYSGAVQVALLENAPGTDPDATSRYEIVMARGWFRYEDPFEQDPRPQLAWEYWNGSGWLRIPRVDDKTGNFLSSGVVLFRVPSDIQPAQVAGQENVWIRARLVGGDYGREVFSVVETTNPGGEKIQKVRSTKRGIEPPQIESLLISYELTVQQLPQHCIAYNNLSFLDQTAECSTPGKHFDPFVPLEDRSLAVYLGFGKPIQGGPIGILFVAEDLRTEERTAPKIVWTFRSGNSWKDLKAADDSEALTRQGIVRFQVPAGFQLRSLFGVSRYWIRGSLIEGEYLARERPRLEGVFPNSVMTVQARTTLDEILGSSTGEADQEFVFLPAQGIEPAPDWSIIGNPEIRIREALTPEELEDVIARLGKDALAEREELGKREMWVLWTEVSHFFASTATDRHYRLDRARGRIRFGDGRHGMIPPAGVDNIRTFRYRAGGGDQGNVKVGEIDTLVTAIAGIDSVINPVSAGGGGDRASLEEMLEIGPARIAHRSRAVTPQDFEWLAREATREVARARCRPNFEVSTDPEDPGRRRAGYVTVYIVPRSTDDLPMPSYQLRRSVERYLEAAAEIGLSASSRIAVRAPRYAPVSVEADVYAKTLDVVGAVAQGVEDRLRSFLHPLTGGQNGDGWEFGRPLAASDIFVQLESIEGVDHVENLRMHFKHRTDSELARIDADEIIARSDPRIRVQAV